MTELDAATLRALLDYDATTGTFTWIAKTGRSTRIGTKAGRTDRRGYVGINIRNRKYAAHRLAWLYTYGEWPAAQIDHIDRDPGNNRILNLRDVTGSENCLNRDPRAFLRQEGTRGITLHKTGKWQAQICLPGGQTKYLGLFETQEEASEAYQCARAAL